MKNFKYLSVFVVLLSLLVISCDGSEDIDSDMALEKEASLKSGKSALKNAKDDCATIQDGTILDPNGIVITTGFNNDGYNYQAQMYNGEPYPVGDWAGWFLNSTWNDAWLSTKDCDHDGELDSQYNDARGSGAYKTEHWTYKHTDAQGKSCTVKIYKKIVAVPDGSTLEIIEGTDPIEYMYYDKDNNEIGKYALPDFALIQSIYNDPCAGENGVFYKSPPPIGLGNR